MRLFLKVIFHWTVHAVLLSLFIIVFKLNLTQVLVAVASTLLMDIDHIPIIIKMGYWFVLEPIRYPLHKISILLITSIGFGWSLFTKNWINIFLSAAFLHLLWDIIEDAVVYRMGIEHWKW